jgi:hypothetical protein
MSAQEEQRKIAFSIDRRSSALSDGSYRGPPTAAAVMWAALPTYTYLSKIVSDGQTVRALHSGLEQMYEARFANTSTVFD